MPEFPSRPLGGSTAGSCSPALVSVIPGGGEVKVAWLAAGQTEEDHVEVYVGNKGLSGVANCKRWTGRGCDSPSQNFRPGMCPMDGTVTLQMKSGFHVIHVLLMSKNGRPRGPHEHVLIYIPEIFQHEDADDLSLIGQLCLTTGTENAFLELGRQCERHKNLAAAATMFRCASQHAAADGRQVIAFHLYTFIPTSSLVSATMLIALIDQAER